MSSCAPILLVDDGELDDVRQILEELGAEFDHLRGGAIPAQVPRPSQVLVATPRRAMVTDRWLASELPVKIGIVTEDSNTLRGMLKRMGFNLLIRRPVHPYALRLVLLRAMYSGSERRRESRFPIGGKISYRAGFRRHDAVLADLSLRGARLLVTDAVAAGGRITIQFDKELAGGKAMALRAVVARHGSDPDPNGQHVVGVQWEKLAKADARRLQMILAAQADGPVTLAEAVGGGATASSSRGPRPTTPEGANATPENRRKAPRAQYKGQVVQLGDEASSVLLGKDISMGGMSISSETHLKDGDQLRLAIYGGPREDPFIVRAQVVRQESAGTYGIQFVDVKPSVAGRLEGLVSKLPSIESLEGEESDALGSVVSRILEREDGPGSLR